MLKVLSQKRKNSAGEVMCEPSTLNAVCGMMKLGLCVPRLASVFVVILNALF